MLGSNYEYFGVRLSAWECRGDLWRAKGTWKFQGMRECTEEFGVVFGSAEDCFWLLVERYCCRSGVNGKVQFSLLSTSSSQ